ncbi:MAG: hypothetical protein JW860_03320 [Sedimentisphaerales bacterium]|nr:hypothetical protein [Sedimentisphaerales bacterium]
MLIVLVCVTLCNISPMITSRTDLKFYLEADRFSLNRPPRRNFLCFDPVWKYQRLMRRLEYLYNCKHSFFYKVYRRVLFRHWQKLGLKLGFSIPLNVFGPGLSLPHPGTIVINDRVRVGANCRVHVCVNIGCAAGAPDEVPQIGDNVYIGPGAKIYGAIKIADNIAIGANAVVNTDFTEPGITIAGIPARKISDKSSEGLLIRGSELAQSRAG